MRCGSTLCRVPRSASLTNRADGCGRPASPLRRTEGQGRPDRLLGILERVTHGKVPKVKTLYQRRRGDGFEVIGLNFDRPRPWRTAGQGVAAPWLEVDVPGDDRARPPRAEAPDSRAFRGYSSSIARESSVGMMAIPRSSTSESTGYWRCLGAGAEDAEDRRRPESSPPR